MSIWDGIVHQRSVVENAGVKSVFAPLIGSEDVHETVGSDDWSVVAIVVVNCKLQNALKPFVDGATHPRWKRCASRCLVKNVREGGNKGCRRDGNGGYL